MLMARPEFKSHHSYLLDAMSGCDGVLYLILASLLAQLISILAFALSLDQRLTQVLCTSTG